MPSPRPLVDTEWFDHALQRLGALPRIERLLEAEFLRLAMYADVVPIARGCRRLRLYQTKPILRTDGQLVRILVYFVLRDDNSVELQHIDLVAEAMDGKATK